eukprot:SAG31_NODE_8110_length_1521_cov_2.914205_2_plen_156_part_00
MPRAISMSPERLCPKRHKTELQHWLISLGWPSPATQLACRLCALRTLPRLPQRILGKDCSATQMLVARDSLRGCADAPHACLSCLVYACSLPGGCVLSADHASRLQEYDSAAGKFVGTYDERGFWIWITGCIMWLVLTVTGISRFHSGFAAALAS